MRLEGPSSRLELEIVGYQFAGARGDRYDDNWPAVEGSVRSGDLHWRFRDPCLMVDEARSIGHWLRHIADPAATTSALRFTEPCLSFDVAERSETHVTLRVDLDLEAAPPESDPRRDRPFVLELPLSADHLLTASAAWLAEMERFPAR